MNNIIETTTNNINGFDTYYMMSDSSRVYDKWDKIKDQIISTLKKLSTKELIEIKKGLENMEMVNIHFKDFFSDLPEPTPTPVTYPCPNTDMKRSVFKNAWSMLKDGLFQTIGQALKASWMRYKLVSRLKSGIAYFEYKKASGELRTAIGTLRTGNFFYEPKTNGTESKTQVIKYFDIEAKAFRSCRVDRLINLNTAA